jgi:hypothetical protein
MNVIPIPSRVTFGGTRVSRTLEDIQPSNAVIQASIAGLRAIFWLLTAAAVLSPLLALRPDRAIAAPPEPLAAFSLPGDLGSFPAAGNQDDPAIARGDDQYLVAWTDDRTSLFDASGNSGSARDVYAARLDADGNLIDTTPIVIDQAENNQSNPAVYWNGSPCSRWSRDFYRGIGVHR